MYLLRGDSLDTACTEHWLDYLLGPDDARAARFREVARRER